MRTNLLADTEGPVYVPSAEPTPYNLSRMQDPKSAEYMQEQVMQSNLRKSNRTYWQRKVDSALLDLLDTNPPSRMTDEQILQVRGMGLQVIPAGEVPSRLGKSGTGDLVLLAISLGQDVSVDSVAGYVAKSDGSGHPLYAWTELNKISSIAGLAGVNQVSIAFAPAFDAGDSRDPSLTDLTNQTNIVNESRDVPNDGNISPAVSTTRLRENRTSYSTLPGKTIPAPTGTSSPDSPAQSGSLFTGIMASWDSVVKTVSGLFGSS